MTAGARAATGRCPHCAARIHLPALLRAARRHPYRCPACAGGAWVDPRRAQRVLLGVFGAAAVAALVGREALAAPGEQVVFALGAIAAAIGLLARLGRFEAG